MKKALSVKLKQPNFSVKIPQPKQTTKAPKKATKKAKSKSRKSSSKPEFGTAAWMTYIRGLRKTKRSKSKKRRA